MDFLAWVAESVADWFSSWFKKDARILFLGLDNAGKPTLMGLLTKNRAVSPLPTIHPTTEAFEIGKLKVVAVDVGGHDTVRDLWEEHTIPCDAIVYVVDAVDKSRFEEAKTELDSLMALEVMAGKPVAVLGNKIDVPYAASEPDFREALGLTYTEDGPVQVFMSSLVEHQGYAEAFAWLESRV